MIEPTLCPLCSEPTYAWYGETKHAWSMRVECPDPTDRLPMWDAVPSERETELAHREQAVRARIHAAFSTWFAATHYRCRVPGCPGAINCAEHTRYNH